MSRGFITTLQAEKIPGYSMRWTLLADLVYIDRRAFRHAAQKGFITDLTTYGPEGRHSEASVLHDWLLAHTTKTRKECATLMYEAMQDLKVNVVSKHIIYSMVRLNDWRHAIKNYFSA